MRKWMKERLQRRKKKPAEAATPAAPPLQPAYFDAEETPSQAPEASEPEAAAPEPEPEASSAPMESAEAVPAQSRAQSSATGRGRRRRGGRGRGGRGGREQAVAAAFTPAVVKGIIPEPGNEADAAVDTAEQEAEPEALAPKAPAAPAVPVAAARPPKGIVVLAIGLPGSGKSSWFKRNNVVPLSSDMVRSLLFDDVREQRFQDLVFSNLRSMLKARLIAKRPMNYVDATNLTPQERQHWIKLAKDYNYEVHAIFFDVPLEVCIERHQRRDLVVPEDVMRRMAAKLKPPAFEEGFAKITVVRVKKKE
jgi:predicted kinase